MKTALVVAFGLLACACAAWGSYVHDWVQVEPAHPYERITFYVALNQRNLDKLEALLYSVSDPKSPSYGRIASQKEIGDLINPPLKEHDFVLNFLTNNRSTVRVVSYGDSLKVTASVEDISNIFSASFHWYHHNPSGHEVIRADYDGITIPIAITNYIYMVTNLVTFPIIMKKQKVASVTNSQGLTDTEPGYFAPSTIRRIYNIPPQALVTNPQSSQCALEFAPEGAFVFSDLATFCKLAEEKFTNFTKIIGPFAQTYSGDIESELDVQVLSTIGSGAENWFWTVTDGWIYEMAVDIYNNETKPWVFSISYGWPEVLTCGGSVVQSNCDNIDNAQYINRSNVELQKLGALRISVITCSQDEGAPSSANMYCDNTTHPIFGIYPGSSPFVTTVSGTTAMPSKEFSIKANSYPPICDKFPCSNSTLEYSCMPNNTYFEWTTGGGFSEFTVAPTYQAAAVSNYMTSSALKPPKQFTNFNNRGYPDVSAIGARVLIVTNGTISIAEGTSASTPIIAGIATLLNDERFNAGKTPLGFLNPILYDMAASNPRTFNDVTVGSNQCTIGIGNCCKYGFGAGVGWDAVSGLGTPNYGEILEYVKALP